MGLGTRLVWLAVSSARCSKGTATDLLEVLATLLLQTQPATNSTLLHTSVQTRPKLFKWQHDGARRQSACTGDDVNLILRRSDAVWAAVLAKQWLREWFGAIKAWMHSVGSILQAQLTRVFFCTKPVMCECLAGGLTPATCIKLLHISMPTMITLPD